MNKDKITPKGHRTLQKNLAPIITKNIVAISMLNLIINFVEILVSTPGPPIILHGIFASNVPTGHKLHIVKNDFGNKNGINITKKIRTKYLR